MSTSALIAQHFEHKEILLLMGSRFEITAIANNKQTAKIAVESGIAEIKRIEDLISSWDKNSQTSDINRNAGIRSVKVDKELFNLIQRAQKVSELTQGAFDITFAGIEKLYQFDKLEHDLPTKEVLEQSISKIDYNQIELNREESTVFLKTKGGRIGFGAIGKGYAANKAKEIMKSIDGVKGGLVNASGDLIAWGENGKDQNWSIQISDPGDIQKTYGWLNLNDMSIVTSGDYEKFFWSNGIRYAHIVDPHTGLPTTGIKSVSIICPDAELGDALATSVFVLGVEKGLSLINKLKNIEAFIIDAEDEVHHSNNLVLNKL